MIKISLFSGLLNILLFKKIEDEALNKDLIRTEGSSTCTLT